MRAPGSDRTKAAVVAGSSVSRPSATISPPLVTAATMAQGSTPGTSSPKTTPRWQMLPARTGSMSSKEMSRSTSSSAGASPATSPSAPTRTATSTSTAGATQPARDTVAPSGDTPVSTRNPTTASVSPKCSWMAGVLKPIFQPTGAAPAARAASPSGELGPHAAGHGGGGVRLVASVGHGASLPQVGPGFIVRTPRSGPPEPRRGGSGR